MKLEEYTLPEIAFIDGQNHNGNSLANRTVAIHFPTMTVVDIVPLDEIVTSSFTAITKNFEYTNFAGIDEAHLMAVHKTQVQDDVLLDTVFNEIWNWYTKYLDWEDRNIIDNELGNLN